MQRYPRLFLTLAVASVCSCACLNPAVAQTEHRHALLRFRGDLDAQRTADEFAEALTTLDQQRPRLILIELTGDRARPDLLFETLRTLRRIETPTAVWLADTDDRRVAPAMLGMALAANHAAIHPKTAIERFPTDSLRDLNPEIEDWAIVNLDLRGLAGDLAEVSARDRLIFESTLAPRSPLWVIRDETGSLTVSAQSGLADARELVEKDAEGWSFSLDAETAARTYRVPLHRTRRAFEHSLGLRARPVKTIEIKSGLRDAHGRARGLVDQVRSAVDLADAALDIRAGRAATSRVMPHEYHAAARNAQSLVAPCRDAIAAIADLTSNYPEILQLQPPADADAPTEIGGPASTSLSAWRGAIRDAEYELARLDDRIETYRRR